MECLIAIGTWVAGKVADYTVAPVCHKLGYIFHYRHNLGNLITETQDLNLQKKRLEDSVDAAISNGEEVYDDVKDWLNKAGQITQQTEKLLGDENHTTIKCTSRGPFPNLVQRFQLSRKAKKMGESVSKIKCEIRFDNISYRPKLQSNFRNNDFINFDTRKEIKRRIMEMLEDGNIKMIGVHGLPGAGKTTLVTEIAREALDKTLFSDSVLVTVSNTPNVENIQKAIAERLDLTLHKETIPERALLLENRLKLEKKFLIILDDLWNDELNFKDLGILIESDDQKGIKILLTSRFEPVLRGDFCVERPLPVELLSENEAWYLFSQIVGDLVKNDPHFQQHGNEIVKECARLPVAIVTIAHTLKNHDLPLWRDVLGKLQSSNLNIKDMHEKVYSSIRLCYDYVSEEAKLLSLLCCLHEEDESISMENLMRYGKGLGIFERVPTLQKARDRVYTLVEELKGGCLLLDNGGMVGTVKMHDVIRDVAISIGKERHVCRFRDGAEVEEYKKRKTLEDSWAISLPNGYVGELVCESFEYKQLQLIWMQGENKSLDIISKNFFEKTKEVRVLCFFSQYLKVLPPSLCFLQNLSTLCMNDCQLGDIALIGELKSLEILDLSESSIKELPRQIGQLTRLRILDLSECKELIVIHPNILSRLTCLEEIMLLNFKNWDKDVEAVNGEIIRNASLLELKDLVWLTHLELYIPDIRMLPKDLFSDELKRYKIFIQIDARYSFGLGARAPSRYLAISKRNESIILQEYGLETLLKRCDALYLSELQGLNNIVYELHKKGFPELKMFCLKNNDTIQYLINNMGQITCSSVFVSLELLWLVNLTNLEKICHGELIVESFKRLSYLRVRECKRLKNLLPFSIATQLEKIEITDCEMMEEIFTHEIDDDDDDDDGEMVGEFPHLCSLKLEKLSKLRKFCSKLKKTHALQNEEETLIVDSSMPFFNGKFVSFPKLKTLEMIGCDFTKIWDDQFQLSSASFHNLTKLEVESCNFMENLFSSAVAASLKQLYSLQIMDCRMMKETMRRTRSMDKMSFPKLNNLTLRNLPNLVSFSSSIFIEFPVLAELGIADCPAFKTFISDSSEQNSCTTVPSLFNEKVAFPRLKNLYIRGMNKPKIFITADVFGELEVVKVHDCNNLTKIFTSNMQRTLGSLRRLRIHECKMVEEVFEIQTSSVEEITHDTIPSSQLWGKDPRGTLTFTHLEDVEVLNCPSLKSMFPFSVAKGLPKLRELLLRDCGIEKIVEAVGTTVPVPPEFVFPQLKDLKLEHLENLVCFYPGLHTSSWPSLTSLVLKRCEKVKVWASELSSFQEKHVLHDHDSSPIPQPFFFTKVAFPSLLTLEIEGLAELKMIWQYKLSSADSFSKLEDVKVRNCNNLVQIFPSSMQRRLHNLKRLEISGCEMVEEVFEIQIMPNVEEVGLSTPSIVMISQDQLTADIFGKLEKINVNGCRSLTTMFSSNMLRNLQNLSKLVIYNCEMLEVVFDLQIPNDHRHETLEVTVPIHLSELNLSGLPNLKHVWGNDPRGTFTFQDLQWLSVDGCQCLKILFPTSVAKNLLQLQSLDIRNCGIEQIVAEEKGQNETIPTFVFPQLDNLTLHNLPRLMSFYPGLHTLKWPKLRWLEVSSFMKAEDLSLKFLRFQQTSGSFSIDEVTSSSQNEDLVGYQEECAGALSRLSVLRLYDMPNLLHLREESTQPQTVFQNLVTLDILRCGRIKKLVPSSISFQNLETLIVRQCHGMPSLLTSRTARSMARLKCLIIFNCKRMEEIIVDVEEGEDMEGEIVLARLKTLVLDCLPSLTCFYSGKYMLGLPDLENVIVSGCFEMLSFSKHGNIVSTPKLHKLVTACEYRVAFEHLARLLDRYGIDLAVTVNDTITAVNTPMDLNTIIPELWQSHPGTALQQLFCEKDLALSNLSVKQSDI